MHTLRASSVLVGFVSLLGCGSDDDSRPETIGLCFRISGSLLQTSCAGGNREGSCRIAGSGYTRDGDCSSFVTCGSAQTKLESDWSKGISPKPPSSGTGGGGSVDCAKSCPSEVSDVQLDSFCRQACCLTLSG